MDTQQKEKRVDAEYFLTERPAPDTESSCGMDLEADAKRWQASSHDRAAELKAEINNLLWNFGDPRMAIGEADRRALKIMDLVMASAGSV